MCEPGASRWDDVLMLARFKNFPHPSCVCMTMGYVPDRDHIIHLCLQMIAMKYSVEMCRNIPGRVHYLLFRYDV